MSRWKPDDFAAKFPEQAERHGIKKSAKRKPIRAQAHQWGVMNGTETRFAKRLLGFKALGLVLGYRFEPETVELAEDCHYTIDFMGELADGTPFKAEVKGRKVWEDSRIKFKWASDREPGTVFIWAKWSRGTWSEEVWQAGRKLAGWIWSDQNHSK